MVAWRRSAVARSRSGEMTRSSAAIMNQLGFSCHAASVMGMSKTAPVLQAVIDDYLKRSRIEVRATHEIDNLGMAISLVASTRGVTLLPAYARNFLPWSVTSRPLEGETPMIDLVVGYQKANRSQILKLFLSRIDDLIARVAHEQATSSEAGKPRTRLPV